MATQKSIQRADVERLAYDAFSEFIEASLGHLGWYDDDSSISQPAWLRYDLCGCSMLDYKNAIDFRKLPESFIEKLVSRLDAIDLAIILDDLNDDLDVEEKLGARESNPKFSAMVNEFGQDVENAAAESLGEYDEMIWSLDPLREVLNSLVLTRQEVFSAWEHESIARGQEPRAMDGVAQTEWDRMSATRTRVNAYRDLEAEELFDDDALFDGDLNGADDPLEQDAAHKAKLIMRQYKLPRGNTK